MWFAVGPSYKKTREDLQSFDENIGNLNPYGKLSLKLVTYNIDKATERRILRYAIQYLNVPVICEDRVGPHLISTALPLNCGSEHNSIVGRHRTIRLAPALGFLPIYGGYRGTGYRLWRSNRGFECRFDRFAGEQNRTTITLGMAGAGKSVSDGFDIMEFKARYPDSAVIVVDNKSSYERLADLLGGKVVKFDEDFLKENPYSPFAIKTWEKEDINLVVSFISSCIAWVNPYAEFTSDHSEILVEAIKMCVNNHAKDLAWAQEHPERAASVPPHFTLVQVLEKLEPAADLKNFRGSMEAVDQLRKWLVPFTKTGQFGFLFSEHEKPQEHDSHKFMVYDLGGISDQRLQSMAAQLVALKLIRDIKKLGRATQKFIIFEELGVFLHGESETTKDIANRLVKNITKTVRKYNGIPHGITNGVEDFFDRRGGQAFWAQATRKIFLPMTHAMIEKLEEKAKDLDSADIDILKSLHIKDGVYTQAYIILGQGRDQVKVVIEIPLSPTAGAVFITTGSVCAYYDDLRSKGVNVIDTLENLSDHIERNMQ
ncbi:MAG TPA: hypothetical protein VE954_10360 [Oligoflexus sp.]|uniref:TraG/VirB4 family ATPase n=1 Tax=Oligoflexus sp. TaxID=1971216 RepID=UPI002D6ED9BD|nr:hypothetical protein [Oligoflexus sp.]HYX33506.1 hypothetical protein [Oligoflexus sp.]